MAEFAPQGILVVRINFLFSLIFHRIISVSDFCCDSDNSESFSTLNCTIHDDNNQNDSSDIEFERNNNDSLEEEISDLVTSLESTQQNLSLSKSTDSNNTLSDISNEMYSNTQNNTNSLITTPNNIDNHSNNTTLNNNDLDNSLNNIEKNIDVGSVLDSPPESVNSKDRRYF